MQKWAAVNLAAHLLLVPKKTKIDRSYIAGSSNGRTSPFEGEYLGSNPSPAAILR